jgi:hemerythrin
MTLVWSEARFATGVDEIDVQHRELFDIANSLVDAARQGRPREEVEQILDILHDHAVTHFTCEEGHMERRNCSACGANKLAHKWFLRDFADLREGFDAAGVTPEFIDEVEEKVCTWLTTHLLAIDTSLRDTAG